MNNDKNIKRAEFFDDIKELFEFLNSNDPQSINFDREKAKELIEKQKEDDKDFFIFNSPLNQNFVSYENATNIMLYNGVHNTYNFLLQKQAKEELKNK